MSGAARTIFGVLEAVRRRMRVERGLRAAATALPWSALCLAWWRLAGPWFLLGFVLLTAVAAVWVRRRTGDDRSLHAVALLIDRRMRFDNVLVTAVELHEGQLRTSQVFHDRVMTEASDRASRVAPSDVRPLQTAARALAAGAAVALVLVALVLRVDDGAARVAPSPSRGRSSTSAAAVVPTVRVQLIPPDYLRAPHQELSNPERLEVLEGTTVVATAAEASLRWVRQSADPVPGTKHLRVVPRASGFISVSRSGALQRVIPLTVVPDDAPRIAIDRPEGDLTLPAAAPVSVSARALDDHGLTAAELRYTRVSGSGEQFEFADGVLPVEIERTAANDWRVSGQLPLARMGAALGDTIVFRIAARDGRAARGEGLSDAVVIDIAPPGSVATAGAAIDPGEDKFALSQQMILLKLRRLHASRRTFTQLRLLEESQSLAGQQRSVRALFVFMLGGEVEDEEVEAAHSHEIQEGRLADTSRRDLVTAVNLMSRVEQHLTAAETGAAIPPAEAAVEAVQRAFGRRRYFLRTTPVRMRIDPSRRFAGDASDAANLTVPGRGSSPSSAALRAMDVLIRLASDGVADSAGLAAAAARVLAVDPAHSEMQRVAAELQESGLSPGRVRALATRALSLLSVTERAQHPGALHADRYGAEALKGAWADEWRSGAKP